MIGENGPIVFQPNDRDISIGIDGTISVREGQNTTDSQRGKLKLATFAQPQQLQKDGTSTFAAPAGVQPQRADRRARHAGRDREVERAAA